jgi:peptide/nickel transport system substrate-binding protein
MRSHKFRTAAVGGVAVLSLVLGACGGGDGGDDGGGTAPEVEAEFDAGSKGIVNASDEKGGTLKFALSDDFDSIDPGDTYYAFSNNFLRFYGRPLLTYKTLSTGTDANTAVPDLAEALGKASDNNQTWEYKLREGLKYEDGSPILAEHVKYAVLRTFDRGVLTHGPAYFPGLIEGGDKFKGPYKDKKWKEFAGIETPDERTIIFHLNKPFAEFNELVMFSGQTVPVPPDKDTGKTYRNHPISSGPYMWEGDYKPGKGGTLVRNENWNAETDPNRNALPDKITVEAGVDADEVDNRLLDGDIHMDLAGSGVQENARKSILGDEAVKANADNPFAGFHWFIPITKNIDNVECRRAIIYATDRDALWRAMGGDVGGEFATNIQPPIIPGRAEIEEVFPWDPDSPKAADTLKQGYHGDVEKAKDALEKCGQPDGFSTKMLFRSDRPKEKKVAEAMQQGLKRVGIKLELKGYPAGTYTSDQFGSPSFNKTNKVGLGTYGWAADWPTGYGYLWPVMSGDAIVESGNTNIPEVKIPELDQKWKDVLKLATPEERAKVYNEIERKVLEEAWFLPNVYAKSLLYRPESVTNVYFHPGFGMYDYVNMGVSE